MPLPCRRCVWSFPMIWPAILEKMFEGFRVNSIWPPNHVTYQLEINKLVKGCLGESVCEFLPQSVQPFWRRFLKFIYFQSKMAEEPCDLWHHKFIFCFQLCSGTRVFMIRVWHKFRVNRIRCVFLFKMAAKPCDLWHHNLYHNFIMTILEKRNKWVEVRIEYVLGVSAEEGSW